MSWSECRCRNLVVAGALCVAGLSVPLASAVGPKPKNVPTDKHPYLLFTVEELRELRAKTRKIVPAATQESFLRKIKREQNDPGFLAFGGLWENDPRILERAKAALLKQAAGKTDERYNVHTGSREVRIDGTAAPALTAKARGGRTSYPERLFLRCG